MRRLRRPALTPGEHDALALAAANRRIVELETANATAVSRLVRQVERHRDGCTHAQDLGRARYDLDLLQQRYAELFQRYRGVLVALREINDRPTEPIKAIDSVREPR